MSSPQFYTQPKDTLPRHLRNEHMMRLNGNLSLVELFALIDELWKGVQPDIPFRPIQGEQFAKYPSIVYSVESKVPEQSDVKHRIREFIENPQTGQLYKITAQKFRHIITFSAVTKLEPELAESIIEAFEDFMFTITPVLVEQGVARIVYGRREPDSVVNKTGEDLNRRTVAYDVYLEKVYQIPVDQLEDIRVRAKVYVERNHNLFTGESGNDYIEVPSNYLEVGKVILVTMTTNGFLPGGLLTQTTYTVTAVDGTKVYLEDSNGDPVTITSDGTGRLSIWIPRPPLEIEDDYQPVPFSLLDDNGNPILDDDGNPIYF